MPLPATAFYLQIAQSNRTIAQCGQYAVNGKTVTLPRNGKVLADATELLEPVIPAEPSPRTTAFHIDDHIRKLDTISCVLELRAEGVRGEILALNFANANIAGGGYILGGNAQEESLCRSSLLYAAIAPQKDFYRCHHLHPSPLYSDRMLYSPDVPVIRTSDGKLLETPQMCSFLTSPAVNRTLAKLCFTREKTIGDAMRTRITKIIAAAAEIKPEMLVLGAFGCGAFGNRRETVLPMFESAVNAYLPDTVQVVFAMP